MPLFQSAVLKKYLKQQDGARIAAAYAAFTKHFHDPAVQANIRERQGGAVSRKGFCATYS
jgi:hypothetical protein